jgi:hypothetical protein
MSLNHHPITFLAGKWLDFGKRTLEAIGYLLYMLLYRVPGQGGNLTFFVKPIFSCISRSLIHRARKRARFCECGENSSIGGEP